MSDRLLRFVAGMTRLVSDASLAPRDVVERAVALKRELVATDDWLADAFAEPDPRSYRQYLLYGDPLERFSVVSFVWGPGQCTPIHDHTVWGVVGMLRGAEYNQPFRRGAHGPEAAGDEQRLEPGQVHSLAPATGDIHRVRNAFTDRVSISIHTYGGNIGRIERSVFQADAPETKRFVSGYSNALAPNLWIA
jgi:predicted metal-dependent enzyme (double-stranded beta helix superfamily)